MKTTLSLDSWTDNLMKTTLSHTPGGGSEGGPQKSQETFLPSVVLPYFDQFRLVIIA